MTVHDASQMAVVLPLRQDIIASSYGDSRTRRCADAFAREPSKGWEEVAKEQLRSGMPLGVSVVKMSADFVKSHNAEAEFPFLAKVDSICSGASSPSSLTEMAIPRVRSSRALKDGSGSTKQGPGVAILGSGNWGCAIAKIIARNCQRRADFQKRVEMWVHEEEVDGRKLTEIINSDHENVKYLPGVALPPNLHAVADVCQVVKDAAILVFVLPHQFLPGLLKTIKGVVLPDAVAVSLVKGYLEIDRSDGSLRTGSQLIASELNCTCAVLNGANVANDVAHEHFAEATLGCSNEQQSLVLWNLLNSQSFSVRTTQDVLGVELCGGFKNVVALAAGFSDGLGFPENTKAAILRRGLQETSSLIQDATQFDAARASQIAMRLNARELFPTSAPETLLESCGLADLLTTCYSGRNRRCAQAFAEDPTQSWEDIEAAYLGGQKLQGPSTCLDVQSIIEKRGVQKKFPLFTAIYKAVTKEITPEEGLSKYHDKNPYAFGDGPPLQYDPAEATTIIMGGNSNWRGPVWFPINYLLIESLQKFHQYYGDDYLVEFPTGSGQKAKKSQLKV
eukprot:s344_g15.t1